MRYLSYYEELTEALSEVKKGLIDQYEEVLASNCEPMKRTVKTFKEKRTEFEWFCRRVKQQNESDRKNKGFI